MSDERNGPAGRPRALVGRPQSELRLGFAALHRLVLPYLDRLNRLTGPHRNALEVTFGLTGGPPPSRFLVSLAALALLSDVAAERPVICLIDNAQWPLGQGAADAQRAHDPFGLAPRRPRWHARQVSARPTPRSPAD